MGFLTQILLICRFLFGKLVGLFNTRAVASADAARIRTLVNVERRIDASLERLEELQGRLGGIQETVRTTPVRFGTTPQKEFSAASFIFGNAPIPLTPTSRPLTRSTPMARLSGRRDLLTADVDLVERPETPLQPLRLANFGVPSAARPSRFTLREMSPTPGAWTRDALIQTPSLIQTSTPGTPKSTLPAGTSPKGEITGSTVARVMRQGAVTPKGLAELAATAPPPKEVVVATPLSKTARKSRRLELAATAKENLRNGADASLAATGRPVVPALTPRSDRPLTAAANPGMGLTPKGFRSPAKPAGGDDLFDVDTRYL